jgi:hypothetical protein
MTKVVADPSAMVAAASRLRLVAEDLATVSAMLRSAELPQLAPDLAARYGGRIQAIGARVAAIPEPLVDAAQQLVHRAEIVQTAADLESDGTEAAHRIAGALDGLDPNAVAPGEPAPEAAPGLEPPPPAPASDAAPAAPAPPAAPADGQPIGGAPAEGVHSAVTDTGAYGAGAADGAAAAAPGDEGLRASHAAVLGEAPPPPVPDPDANPQDWACWMATHAAHEDVPPSLPIAMALAGSGMHNLDEHGGNCGFFALRAGEEVAPPGFGVGPATQPDASWWRENPDAQLTHVLRSLGATKPEEPGEADLVRWATDAQPTVEGGDLSDALSVARTLVAKCRHGIEGPPEADPAPGAAAGAAPPATSGATAFAKTVESQLGVAETAGANAGPEVDNYLQSASVGSGNPWCASFMAWAMKETGQEMPGSGWAAVSTWVQAAESGAAGLQMVPPEEARPGDIVAYDWGGDGDFGADGHIGMLESEVRDGRFTTIEGNAADAVTRMERSLGEGQVVFLRRVE